MATSTRSRKATLVDQYVAQQIRRRRDEMATSQQDLAQKLGLSFQQLQKFERGVNRISAARLYDLANHLGVPMSYFFEGLENIQSEATPAEQGTGSQSLLSLIVTTPKSEEVIRAFAGIKTEKRQQKVLDLIKLMEQSG